jgi:ABC-type thiamin/hydroxymethylpyrimidine transport system permease subunit
MFGKVAILNALVSAVSAGMSFALNSFTHYSNTVLMLSQAPSFGMAASTR